MIPETLTQLFLILAGFCGFILAFYIHTKKKAKQPLVCPLRSSCESVVHSNYSKFLGVPVELFGLAYYALIAVSHLFLLAYKNGSPGWFSFVVLVISFFSFLFSLYLVSIQAFVLKQWCTWCLFSAFLCTVIFLLTVTSIPINITPFLLEHKKIVTIFHLFGMAIGVGAATITDIFFFKFLRDFRISEEESDIMNTLSHVIWCALGILVASGVGLYLPQADILGESPKFLVKMIAVIVLIVNGFLLNIIIAPKLVHITFGEPHPHKPGELHKLRHLSYALGAISITTWYFTFVLGALRNISFSFSTILVFYVTLLVIAIIGSQLYDYIYVAKK